jgi:hypothetical protein
MYTELMEFRPNFDRIKEESEHLRKEVRERTVGYIVAALGLVVGLAWNDAVKALIESLYPAQEGGLSAKFIYALVITGVLVVATVLLVRWSGRSESK